jgi:hypothetical protein
MVAYDGCLLMFDGDWMSTDWDCCHWRSSRFLHTCVSGLKSAWSCAVLCQPGAEWSCAVQPRASTPGVLQ